MSVANGSAVARRRTRSVEEYEALYHEFRSIVRHAVALGKIPVRLEAIAKELMTTDHVVTRFRDRMVLSGGLPKNTFIRRNRFPVPPAVDEPERPSETPVVLPSPNGNGSHHPLPSETPAMPSDFDRGDDLIAAAELILELLKDTRPDDVALIVRQVIAGFNPPAMSRVIRHLMYPETKDA